MRFVLLMLPSLVVFAVTTPARAQESPAATRNLVAELHWLAGVWSNQDASMSIEERWTPPAGGGMLGVSRTIKSDQMVAFEYLRIVQRSGTLVYIAQPNGQPPTEFVLSRQSRRSATFENPRHDFPKVIQYTLRQDGKLEARVGDGAGKEELFLFARVRD